MVFHTCAVPGCLSSSKKIKQPENYPWLKDLNVYFVPFPSKNRFPRLLAQWLRAIRRSDLTPNRHTRICSIHFTNFSGPKDKHDVPTLFHWNSFGQPESVRQSRTSQKAHQDGVNQLQPPGASSTATSSTSIIKITQDNTKTFPGASCQVANFEEVIINDGE